MKEFANIMLVVLLNVFAVSLVASLMKVDANQLVGWYALGVALGAQRKASAK